MAENRTIVPVILGTSVDVCFIQIARKFLILSYDGFGYSYFPEYRKMPAHDFIIGWSQTVRPSQVKHPGDIVGYDLIVFALFPYSLSCLAISFKQTQN